MGTSKHEDRFLRMRRTKTCSHWGHIGHLFRMASAPTGTRHGINPAALNFTAG
jgi:peptide methionine sulfoxide reductase MsrB